MKILYFTFIVPTEKFGGGIAVLQSLYSLCGFADVDYVGPEFQKEELDAYKIKLSHYYLMKQDAGIMRKAYNFIFHGVSTGFYKDWNIIVNRLDATVYDCVYLDFTRQDFVVQWAKRKGLPVVVRAHNVEADYFSSLFKNQKSFISYAHQIIGKRAEKKCVLLSDKVLVLTKRDQNRFIELYGVGEEHYPIIPISVKHFSRERREALPESFVLITGSLWFGPNASGTEWFLDNVWRNVGEDVQKKYSLVIAGAKPNEKIKKLAKELPKVSLFENPKYIDAYYLQASVYIAPIFYGAGMKVKIAEALSCGIPVIATSHAMAGYESVADELFCGDTWKDFAGYLSLIAKKTETEIKCLNQNILESFEQNYSLQKSSDRISKVICDMIGE